MTDARRTLDTRPKGLLAREIGGVSLPIQVLHSQRGYYIGTCDEGGPVSRESYESWPTADQAEAALKAGPDAWTQNDLD
jgi:hypothetical protein